MDLAKVCMGNTVACGSLSSSIKWTYSSLARSIAITVVARVICMYLGMLAAGKYIHSSLLKSVLRWPVTTFDTVPTGRIVNRFGFDIDVLDTMLPNNFTQLLDFTVNVSCANH